MINIIVITHGDFGAYLIEAAETIVGAQVEGLKNVSISPRLSFERIRQIIEETVKETDFSDGMIFMIDMPGGTPMNVVLPLVKDTDKTAVICGININMMISAFAYRKTLNFENLIAKILEDGKKSICEVKRLLLKK
ncbi:MAG: hypothetical protein HY746_02570 [Elusimicrobia bacterium]|nr:hypothetical protein [Elusimicrobiota bacterium]